MSDDPNALAVYVANVYSKLLSSDQPV